MGWLLLPFRLPVVFGSNRERVQIFLIHSLALAPSRHIALSQPMIILLLQTVFSHSSIMRLHRDTPKR